MMGQDMNEARIRGLIDAYGADPARWPAEERQEAQALMVQSPALLDYAEEARGLDDLLFAHEVAAPGTELVERVLRARPRPQTENPLRAVLRFLWPGEAAWVPAGALAASMAFGIYIGTSGAFVTLQDDNETQAALIALAFADMAVEDDWNE